MNYDERKAEAEEQGTLTIHKLRRRITWAIRIIALIAIVVYVVFFWIPGRW